MSPRFARFVAVGTAAAVTQYSTLIALVEVAHLDPVVSSVIGFCAGGCINYILNRWWVFRSQRTHMEALPRFLIVASIGLLGNGLLMQLLNARLGWPYLLAQVATTGVLMLWHYTANALWTFAEARR